MGGKGDIDIDITGGADPRNDYVSIADVLPAEWAEFPDGAGDVEEMLSGNWVDAGGPPWYYEFTELTMSDYDYFGFSLYLYFQVEVGSIGALAADGDYYLDFTNNRVYIYGYGGAPAADGYCHMCPEQIEVSGTGPLVDAYYEQTGVLYPSGPKSISMTSSFAHKAQWLFRWPENGNLLAYIIHPISVTNWWPLDTPMQFEPSTSHYFAIWWSDDDGATWNGGPGQGPAGGDVSDNLISGAARQSPRNWFVMPGGIVTTYLRDRNWGADSSADMLGSVDYGRNWLRFFHARAEGGYITPIAETSAAGGYVAADQRQVVDPITYAGAFNFVVKETSGGGPYPQYSTQLWRCYRTALSYPLYLPLYNLFSTFSTQWTHREIQSGASVLIGSDNYYVYNGQGSTTGTVTRIQPLARCINVTATEDMITTNLAAMLFGTGNKHYYSYTGARVFSSAPYESKLFIITNHDNGWIGSGVYDGMHVFKSEDGGTTWEWMTDPALGNYPTGTGLPCAGNLHFPKDFIYLRPDTYIIVDVLTLTNDNRSWITEDGGYTWTRFAPYVHSSKPGYPYPDPTGDVWSAANGNYRGLWDISNMVREDENYIWLNGNWDSDDDGSGDWTMIRGQTVRILVAPADYTFYVVCSSEAGFIIRAQHVNELRTKLQSLNNTVQAGGTNPTKFGIDLTMPGGTILPRVEANNKAQPIRAEHYYTLRREFETKIRSEVATAPGTWIYTDGADLTDPEYDMPTPIVDGAEGISIRTLIGMRKIIQALYTNGWFCACYSYCPCQTDITISGGGSKK